MVFNPALLQRSDEIENVRLRFFDFLHNAGSFQRSKLSLSLSLVKFLLGSTVRTHDEFPLPRSICPVTGTFLKKSS